MLLSDVHYELVRTYVTPIYCIMHRLHVCETCEVIPFICYLSSSLEWSNTCSFTFTSLTCACAKFHSHPPHTWLHTCTCTHSQNSIPTTTTTQS